MNIEMALKSRIYIFDLDLVKLSLGIFFFLSCLIESIFHQLSGSTFIFVKNTHRKAANLMFGLISPVAQSPAWSVEGQYMSVKLNYVHYLITVLSSTALQCRRELYSPLGPGNRSTNEVSVAIVLGQEGIIILTVIIFIVFFNITQRTAFVSTQNLLTSLFISPLFS